MSKVECEQLPDKENRVPVNVNAGEVDEFLGMGEDDFNDAAERAFTCSKLRTRISQFLATNEMTKTKFLETIGVNSKSLRDFMSYKGTYQGVSNAAFRNGCAFFYRRDQLAKTAKAKKPPTAASSGSRVDKKAQEAEVLTKVASVNVPDDEPVFDDCDEVRRKINMFLATEVMTQAAFLRALGGINNNSLRRFLSYGGKDGGAGQDIYPAAYRFFEKLRIANGEEKSSARRRNERDLPSSGFPLCTNRGTWVLMPTSPPPKRQKPSPSLHTLESFFSRVG
eukprot:jgi/Mesvir1/15539/Mv03189-RA.1